MAVVALLTSLGLAVDYRDARTYIQAALAGAVAFWQAKGAGVKS